MLGTQERWQEELFVAGPLSSLVPDDHILKQVDKVLDLSWLRGEVKDLYCMSNGRPGIDPEAAVRFYFFAGSGNRNSPSSGFWLNEINFQPFVVEATEKYYNFKNRYLRKNVRLFQHPH